MEDEDEGGQWQEEAPRVPTGMMVGVPTVVGGRYAYVGVPVDHPDGGIPPPPDARIGELGLSRGVGDDVAGANRAAKIRARRDAEEMRWGVRLERRWTWVGMGLGILHSFSLGEGSRHR